MISSIRHFRGLLCHNHDSGIVLYVRSFLDSADVVGRFWFGICSQSLFGDRPEGTKKEICDPD